MAFVACSRQFTDRPVVSGVTCGDLDSQITKVSPTAEHWDGWTAGDLAAILPAAVPIEWSPEETLGEMNPELYFDWTVNSTSAFTRDAPSPGDPILQGCGYGSFYRVAGRVEISGIYDGAEWSVSLEYTLDGTGTNPEATYLYGDTDVAAVEELDPILRQALSEAFGAKHQALPHSWQVFLAGSGDAVSFGVAGVGRLENGNAVVDPDSLVGWWQQPLGLTQ